MSIPVSHSLVPSSGAYCAVVIISLLNIPLELPSDSPAKSRETNTLLTGIPEYVRRCKSVLCYFQISTKYKTGQTYEGGISSRPDGEAHGAYAFCGLACLSILGDPRVIIHR